MYSSSAIKVLTAGHGVNLFTLDQQIGEYVLINWNMKITSLGSIYSLNWVMASGMWLSTRSTSERAYYRVEARRPRITLYLQR